MESHSGNNYILNHGMNPAVKAFEHEIAETIYEAGIAHLQEGKYQEANEYFKKIIAVNERDPEAHYLLGYCYQLLNKYDNAVDEYRRALELNPLKTDALNNTGVILTHQEKNAEAERCFKLVLKISPGNQDAYINLGNLKFRNKEFGEAIEKYSLALENESDDPAIYLNLGNCYYELGDYKNAIQNFNIVLVYDPQNLGAINNLGLVYYNLKEFDRSLRFFNKALELSPGNALNFYNIANVYRSLGKPDIALIYYKKAVESDSTIRMGYVYIADILFEQGKEEAAWEYYNIATDDKASQAISFSNLGLDMMRQMKFDEALRYFDVALTATENIPEIHYNKSHIYLLQGKFIKGWDEYEWRLKRSDNRQPDYDKPFLNTPDIAGKKILVTDEQGIGDSIQFARYFSLLKNKGAFVIFECREKLMPLFRKLRGVDILVEKRAGKIPAVDYDYHIPLLSLPNYFKSNSYTIPHEVPYLIPAGEMVKKWAHEIRDHSKLKVGLVWAGNPSHTNDENRSCSLSVFEPLLKVKDADFYSLQKGKAAEQVDCNPWGIIDIAGKINSLEDTAAVISNLDIVISVDTSVAHLAGALGKPVMVLLPKLPDWRWQLNRTDSPWYPTMKLFRQENLKDWEPVIAGIKEELHIASTGKKDRVRVQATGSRAEETLYLGLSTGGNYGWGVCSNYLRKELAGRLNIVNIDPRNEIFKGGTVNGPVVHTLNNNDFKGLFDVRGTRNFGYTFFENELSGKAIKNASEYELIFAGSSWNEQKLRERGVENTRVLIQGIDPELFYPGERKTESNLFVIFSGGKFELRKGQDLVIKAVKILQQKYPDIMLVNAWYNMWPKTMQAMAVSGHIKYEYRGRDWQSIMGNLYRLNGLDERRIVTMPLVANNKLRDLYSITDLGLFPNRCEGGTNLAMMEYMACGKPVIASYNTGHKDVLTRDNSIMLENMKDFRLYDTANNLFADWKEPDFDELVSKIEYAYNNREALRSIGSAAAESMKRHTWSAVADNLIKHIYR